MAEADEQGTTPEIAGDYYCHDFLWEDLRNEVEKSKFLQIQRFPEKVDQRSSVEAWRKFHLLHAKHFFFKERRYLVKEFPDLLSFDKEFIVLEIGCGTGSSVLPVIRASKKAIVYACDCSESALERATKLVRSIQSSSEDKCRFFPFHCDISTENLPSWLHCLSCIEQEEKCYVSSKEEELSTTLHRPLNRNVQKQFRCLSGIDIIMMIFTLSSIPPLKMRHVIQECFRVLKPGGLLLFRDYGLYDMTMLRFSPAQRIGECLFQRGDGTLSYFFSREVLQDLFIQEGFSVEQISYCCVELKNRKKGGSMKRVWIHAKFSKSM